MSERDKNRDQLIKAIDDILKAINAGNDVELRKAPGGDIKVMVVRKSLIKVS